MMAMKPATDVVLYIFPPPGCSSLILALRNAAYELTLLSAASRQVQARAKAALSDIKCRYLAIYGIHLSCGARRAFRSPGSDRGAQLAGLLPNATITYLALM